MRKAIFVALFAASAAMAAPLPAAAWDYPGHRIVGAIADLVLQQHYPKTYKRVSDLLEIKRPGDLWQKRALREVAVFPDCAKKGNEPYCGRPSSEEELSYAEHNSKNDKFHYTDVPLQQPKYAFGLAGTDDLDVVHMINYLVEYLRTVGDAPPTRAQKKDVRLNDTEAVWLLAHLVGDIHQPLHVGAKYYDKACETSVDPNAVGGMANVSQTVGGNLIYITPKPPVVPPAGNLHLFWDSTTVLRAMKIAGQLGNEQEYAKALAGSPPNGWNNMTDPAEKWAEQWATEIMPRAKDAHDRLTIIKGSKPSPFFGTGGCTWETTVDDGYQDWAAMIAEEQLKKAGFRLAALLVAIFPNTP
jgi:hypothetical protein